MVTRRFRHRFLPSTKGTGALDEIEFTTAEIADAAVREITQVQLGAAPFALFLSELLVPNSPWFCWATQLGQVRETRVSLSALFGRFIARAYLTHYCNFAYFEPIHANEQALNGWPSFFVRKNDEGDLPDWVVATVAGANEIAIAEAKGSYNASGAQASLKAAKKQVQRIDIISGGNKLIVKRYAIATRWAVQAHTKLVDPWLMVDDPEEGDRKPTDAERAHLIRSIALGHFAALASGFGAHETADALQRAKVAGPGQLRLPEGEQYLMQRVDRKDAFVIGAAVTSYGIIPFPRDSRLEQHIGALRDVFRGNVMYFVIDVRNLEAIDMLSFPSGQKKAAESDDGSFWSRHRVYEDGSEIMPVTSARLSSRRPNQVSS